MKTQHQSKALVPRQSGPCAMSFCNIPVLTDEPLGMHGLSLWTLVAWDRNQLKWS